jgi:hypothetical protein
MLNVSFYKASTQKAHALFEVLLRFFTDHYDPKNLLFYMYAYRGGATRTGDFKCREVETGFCRNRSSQTGSSGTLIGWKSGQTTFVPLWDRMEGI